MAKKNEPDRRPYTPRGGASAPAGLLYVVLGGTAILLVLAGWNLSELRSLRADLNQKVAQLDAKIAQIQTAPRQQPPQRGPDPARVYTVKTDGSPSKGNAGAPVTIAEFSDFQ